MKNTIRFILLLVCLFVVGNGGAMELATNDHQTAFFEITDIDPLVDLTLTIDILALRSLDTIDVFSEPDFFIKAVVNEQEFTSPIWYDSSYLYDCWSFSTDIVDESETVTISFQVWDWNEDSPMHCDCNGLSDDEEDGWYITIIYDVRTGHWYGDDYYLGDSSGYGRGNGCGDGSIYQRDRDCELWFNIYQNDYDGDGIPYWMEINMYHTDPLTDNRGEDTDNDGVPIEWEHRWGFNPLYWEDHQHFDPDGDSLTNVEEYRTSAFGSDPFRKDIFLEIDYMDDIIIDEDNSFPKEASDIVKDPFHRRNICFHVDSGILDGGEVIPFDKQTTFDELLDIYHTFFLHDGEYEWKRSIFHYAIIVNYSKPNGFAFSGDVYPYWGYIPGTNGFILSNTLVDRVEETYLNLKSRAYIYSSLIMHEMGHNFGIRFGEPLGCDNQLTKYPYQIGWWKWRTYKSIMNYRYTYTILDYSDGSHGRRDNDDWEQIDLGYFEIPSDSTPWFR